MLIYRPASFMLPCIFVNATLVDLFKINAVYRATKHDKTSKPALTMANKR